MITKPVNRRTAINVNLTFSESQVANYLCLGLRNIEIAKLLYISEKTVKNHLSSIYRKLAVRNRIEAVIIILSWPAQR